MKSWTSGKRSEVAATLCQGDVIEFRLKSSSVNERPVNGFAPHLVFIPEFGQKATDKLGGSELLATDPVEFRMNLAPFRAPYRGQLYLDGGFGAIYSVAYTRSCCQPPFPDDPTISIRGIDTTPIQLPRGIYAVSAEVDCDLDFAIAGDAVTLSLVPGQRVPLGNLAQGTVAATAGTVKLATFHVRL